MVLRMRGGTRTDVIYGGEDWLPEWAAAGWLAPLEKHYPELRSKYGPLIANYALRDMTYNGQLYGLPYYADMFTFQYNAKILKDHGIAVPKNWDDVLQASLKLQKAGMDKPFSYVFNQELPHFYQEFVSQVYGRGGRMFDDDSRPLFNNPDSEAFKHLQWLPDAVTKHKIVAFETADVRVVDSLNTGKHAFTVMWNYLLARLNDRITSLTICVV